MTDTFTSSRTRSAAGNQPASAAENQSASRPGDKTAETKEPSLKGTFIAVMLLGGFIIASWVLVLALFLSRN
ncbi:hypothetical protein SD70_09865 [Gordoniibacillus kamchatkensis]|uniref:Cytochrome c oxidase subunit 2A n=2 Tax=Gordoniibacillus kamchatkensis TaxID=1590651 RepID=A0ABR5AIZ5_9BACL|nr:hypothetical protein SD70_09865 [Paenibacillus sp. VKM B-2647]